MKPHWTLDDIDWTRFRPDLVDPETVKAVKAAALVEFNATDYVAYLRRVFGDEPATMDAFERWGEEEVQHGRALARWAKLADPAFDFETSIARFRAGYRLPLDAEGSVRGSQAGEMIARCVVESGTSSYYSAIRDATEEPLLRDIAAHIAADEFRHYRLFFETFHHYRPRETQSFLDRAKIAFQRVAEAEDDELAYAYYCANVSPEDSARIPYNRLTFSKAYNARILRFYRPRHVRKSAGMIAKAVGLPPHGAVARVSGNVMWWVLRARGRKFMDVPGV